MWFPWVKLAHKEGKCHEKFQKHKSWGLAQTRALSTDWFHFDFPKYCHTGQVKSWKEVFVYWGFLKNPFDAGRFSPHPCCFLNVSNLSERKIVGLANSLFPADPVSDYSTAGDESVVQSPHVIIHDYFPWQGIETGMCTTKTWHKCWKNNGLEVLEIFYVCFDFHVIVGFRKKCCPVSGDTNKGKKKIIVHGSDSVSPEFLHPFLQWGNFCGKFKYKYKCK